MTCIHSAIAPNMNRCSLCGMVWNGERWEAPMTDTNTSGADVLAPIDDAVWYMGAALGEKSSGAAKLSQARTAVAALIEREAALIADRDAARRERDEEAEERERAELELAYLANEMIYEGNSIGWIASKAKNYGNALIEAWAALNDGGYRRPAGEMPNLTEAIKQHCDALASEVKALREATAELISADVEYDEANAEHERQENADDDDDLYLNSLRRLQWAQDRRASAIAAATGGDGDG